MTIELCGDPTCDVCQPRPTYDEAIGALGALYAAAYRLMSDAAGWQDADGNPIDTLGPLARARNVLRQAKGRVPR